MGTLYLVGTPIGHLGDLTFRAKETLESADLILCEDTRVTKKLLNHYGITTTCRTYHQHTKLIHHHELLDQLRAGTSMALVSDAGTPGINDPGSRLVAYVRENEPDIPIIPIPGPSAMTAILSVSGMPADDVVFLGFPPNKKGRKTFFESLKDYEKTIILFESPHRILKTLASLQEVLGDRQVVVGRELTKMHEEVRSGTAAEHSAYYKSYPDKCRGEFVLVIGPE